MVHDQQVHHKWHVLLIFFMSCPELPMGISGVGSFTDWHQNSLQCAVLDLSA